MRMDPLPLRCSVFICHTVCVCLGVFCFLREGLLIIVEPCYYAREIIGFVSSSLRNIGEIHGDGFESIYVEIFTGTFECDGIYLRLNQ